MKRATDSVCAAASRREELDGDALASCTWRAATTTPIPPCPSNALDLVLSRDDVSGLEGVHGRQGGFTPGQGNMFPAAGQARDGSGRWLSGGAGAARSAKGGRGHARPALERARERALIGKSKDERGFGDGYLAIRHAELDCNVSDFSGHARGHQRVGRFSGYSYRCSATRRSGTTMQVRGRGFGTFARAWHGREASLLFGTVERFG